MTSDCPFAKQRKKEFAKCSFPPNKKLMYRYSPLPLLSHRNWTPENLGEKPQTFRPSIWSILPREPFTQETVLILLMRDGKYPFNSLCDLMCCCKQCT